jgi:hypothetical protein
MFNLFKNKEAVRTIAQSLSARPAIPEDAPLDTLGSELLELHAHESANHHRMGELYNHIVDRKLAEKAGYKDAKEYFSKKLADLSQSALSRYGAVARVFSEPVARRFGVTCLHLLLNYKEAVDLKVNPEEPGNTPIEVPDEKGVVSTLPFSQCSVEQLRRAIQRKRKPASTKPLPPEKVVLGEQYSEAVALRFPKGKGAVVKVALRNQKGHAVLDFKGIPVEQVLRLAEALTSELPLVRARRTASGGWVVQLTDAPLDLDNPAHLDALKQAYERFPEIGGRAAR